MPLHSDYDDINVQGMNKKDWQQVYDEGENDNSDRNFDDDIKM